MTRAGSAATDLIYDLGMNVGDDTAFYLSQGYRVVAIEADPSLALAGRQRFAAEIESGRAIIENVGISEHEGTADFWLCEDQSVWNSFHCGMASREGRPHRSIRIPTKRLASILAQYGVPYYLKIDIEGNEHLCLKDLSPASLPRFISLESGESGEEGLTGLRTLAEIGFSAFKLIDQATFVPLSFPSGIEARRDAFARNVLLRPPMNRVRGSCWMARRLLFREKLGRRFGRAFPPGSSGVWGDDLPGRWMSHAEAEQAYKHYRSRHFADSHVRPYSFWCDWHARAW